MYCTRLLSDVGKNFRSISFWHLGHTCLCVVICLKICSFKGGKIKQSRQNMVYATMCKFVFWTWLFSSHECVFLLIFTESCFLLRSPPPHWTTHLVQLCPWFIVMAVIYHCFVTLSSLSPPFSYWLGKATEEKVVRERKLVFANDNLFNIYRLQDSGSPLCAFVTWRAYKTWWWPGTTPRHLLGLGWLCGLVGWPDIGGFFFFKAPQGF